MQKPKGKVSYSDLVLLAGAVGIGSRTHEAVASGANLLSDELRHGCDEVGCL